MKIIIGFIFKTVLGFVAINTQSVLGTITSMGLFAWALHDLWSLSQMVS